jgi:hypothetical protein
MRLTPTVRVGAVLVGTALIGAASLPSSSAVPASTHHTRVISSCVAAKYKPAHYVLTCADGNTQIKHVSYSSWTAQEAFGHGTYFYNTCSPSCADGTFKHHPVTLSLGRARTVHGVRLFTRMYVSYAGLTETFQLPTSKV